MATEKDTKQREIKFRAKGVDGRWWYGEDNPTTVLRRVSLATFFMNLAAGVLDPKTLGQYIDRKDTNSKDIYEGDLVRPFYDVAGYGGTYKVYYSQGAWEPFSDNCDLDHTYRYKINGNIHDNPEILEKS